ncbi:hypothetical protein ACE15K_25920 [Citrobacter farmeri]
MSFQEIAVVQTAIRLLLHLPISLATPNDRLRAKVLLLLNGITYISSGSDTGSHPIMLRFRWQSLFFNKPLFPWLTGRNGSQNVGDPHSTCC